MATKQNHNVPFLFQNQRTDQQNLNFPSIANQGSEV